MEQHTLPLVSCIMPTSGRPRWAQQAIRYFLRQDYPNRELVILDGGSGATEAFIPADPRIRYQHVSGTCTLGAKRNLCVEASRGGLILHWDDDDWFAAHRISYQVDALLRTGAEICGLSRMLFHRPLTGRTWLYEYPMGHERRWLAGGSLLYTKRLWSRGLFPDRQVASDTSFVWSHALDDAVTLEDYEIYVAMIHRRNTSPKLVNEPSWTPWRGDLRRILGDELEFYDFARRGEKNAAPVRAFLAASARIRGVSTPPALSKSCESQDSRWHSRPAGRMARCGRFLASKWTPARLAPPGEDLRFNSAGRCTTALEAEIIVPTFGQEAFTLRCFESLLAHTASYRLVWVDNGSSPASRAAVMAGFTRHRQRLSIWSGRNLGFVGGVNVALRAILGDFSSDAKYVVLLNNDTEVTPQWLERLTAALKRDPSLAAVGPMTSPSPSWQAWPNVFAAWGEEAPESTEIASSCEVSRALAAKFGDRVVPVSMIAFFCTAFRKRVIEEIGLLDPRFGVGFGDDDDYCFRLRGAGYSVALVPGAYVVHHHRTTFRAVYTESEIAAMQRENLAKYRAKHGID